MFLAIKEIWHNKARFTLILLVIFLTSYLIYFLLGLAMGLGRNNRTAIDQWPAKTVLISNYANKNLSASVVSQQQLTQAHVQNKGTPIGQLAAVANRTVGAKTKYDISVFGIHFNSFIRPKLTSGRLPANNQEVVVDDGLIRQGFKLNDKIQVNGSQSHYKIVGITHDNRFYTLPVVFMNLASFRQIRFGNANISNINGLVLQHKVTFKGAQLTQLTKQDLINHIPGYTEQIATFALMIGGMVIIIFLVIGIFMYILTLQKLNTYGIMRAQGIGTQTIVNALFSQIFLVSFVGVALAILMLWLTQLFLPATVPFYSSWWLTLGIGLVNILIAVLGGFISLPKILRIDPLQAIGGGN